MPIPATLEKMLVFTAYFQLVVTPPEDSPCHLLSPFVPTPWEATTLKKKKICLPFWTFSDQFGDSRFLVYSVALEDFSL